MEPVAGLTVGQRHEPSAICVAELERRGDEGHFLIRLLERLPAGTAYPDVADRVGEVSLALKQRSRGSLRLFMNATGQGEALVDLVAKHWAGEHPVAVYFTHGDQRIQESYRKIRLGKAWLVTRLQTLLQTDCLHLPRIPEGEQLAEDLLNYQIQVDESANDRYGAFQVGRHDDLVTALGLAVQTDPPPPAVAVRARYC